MLPVGGAGASVEADGIDLFGEQPGRAFIVSGARAEVEQLGRLIGTVGGSELRIGELAWPLDELGAAHAALAPLFP